MKHILVLALAAATIVAAPAEASLFGGKRKPAPPPEYRVTMPAAPTRAPAPANGAIFQASAGYAGLYEG